MRALRLVSRAELTSSHDCYEVTVVKDKFRKSCFSCILKTCHICIFSDSTWKEL